jgi:predicted CoA-substrate-specific enzyme activase
MEENTLLGASICDSGTESEKTADEVFKKTLSKCRLVPQDIKFVVATGYGRVRVPFANKNISEISCHALGINWYFPSVRTILDVGGQDSKAIRCDGKGNIVDFKMNDKCAGGTGRFLEMMADVLHVNIGEIGTRSLQSTEDIVISNICAVFARSEAISALRNGAAMEDILAGLHDAIANRCINILKRVSIEKDLSITGGIAKNIGFVTKVKNKLGIEPLIAADPQIIGAVGAALFALDAIQEE